MNFLVDCLISDRIEFTMSANNVTPLSFFTVSLLKAHLTMEPRRVSHWYFSPRLLQICHRKCFLRRVWSASSPCLQPRSETKIATRSHYWNVSSAWCLDGSSHEIFQVLLLRRPPLSDNHDSYPRSWRQSLPCKVSYHHQSIQHTGDIWKLPVCYWNMPCL